MQRRGFLSSPLAAFALTPESVVAYGDGIPHTPTEYAKLLQQIGDVPVDNYSVGGIVETLERRMAEELGKEFAVWLPTGTLANQLAMRILAGQKKRALVQAESHLYRDCGDCAQTLSGLHLVGLAKGRATFTLEEAQEAAADASQGRVVTPIGAIQIESPVRRQFGARFDFAEMQKISQWARREGIGMHLDGARLYLECAYTGRSVKDYAALFDTVYVSMYKYFNAASGAILAGPKSLLENLFHTRRMFGGSVAHAWPYAAISMHYLQGFPDRIRRAVERSEQAITLLQKDERLKLERIPQGTNIFRVHTKDAVATHKRLSNVATQAPVQNRFQLQVNETWLRQTPESIAAAFSKALA
jgi:threonine aldolase